MFLLKWCLYFVGCKVTFRWKKVWLCWILVSGFASQSPTISESVNFYIHRLKIKQQKTKETQNNEVFLLYLMKPVAFLKRAFLVSLTLKSLPLKQMVRLYHDKLNKVDETAKILSEENFANILQMKYVIWKGLFKKWTEIMKPNSTSHPVTYNYLDGNKYLTWCS